MQIGAVIRKYRLDKKMTQEEVATRLGVTAPAVNKWERGHSMPDITLLSPLARLLDISLDTLLSHTDALTDDEANRLLERALEKLENEPFEAALGWAKEQLWLYPNSAFLSLFMARILLSQLQMHHPELEEVHTPFFVDCYKRALGSEDESVKSSAADALYYHHMGRGEYEAAEGYLDYFSRENPERKRKQAAVYRQMGRRDEALRMCEELLYADYQSVNSTFQELCHSAIEDGDFERAHYLADKMSLLARLFEMGEYHEASAGLELAMLEQDADRLFACMQRLLGSVESIAGFTQSALYAHMELGEPDAKYHDEVRRSLLDCLKEEQCAFIREDARFEALLEQYG